MIQTESILMCRDKKMSKSEGEKILLLRNSMFD